MLHRLIAVGLLVLAGCGATQPRSLSETSPTLRRAEAAFDRRDYKTAATLYRTFLRHEPTEDLVPEAMYRLALSYYRSGAYGSARATLDDLRGEFPRGDWVQAWTLYGDVDAALGRRVSAVLWWERAWDKAEARDRGSLSARITSLSVGLTPAERRHARKLATTEFVQRTLDQPPKVSGGTVPPDVAAAVPPAVSPPPPVSVTRSRLGVLLPLSGDYAAVGRLSLEGLRLVFPEGDERLLIRDTEADPERAVAELRDLAADGSVVAVIGPLHSRVAAAVAPEAERAGIPLVMLSQREGLAGASVFPTAMTRSLQARVLAEHAIDAGRRRFAVVYPADAYGRQMAGAFREAVERGGGRIVGLIAYVQGQNDFESAMEQLEAWDTRYGLDAVLVPDEAERAAFIGPQIRDKLPRVQLLGTSGWNNPAILDGVATAIEGAVFVDGFFASSRRPATRTFVQRFTERYGHVPGILEAQAYDAALLVAPLLARPARTRHEVRASLQNYGAFVGAAGNIEIWNGKVRRDLFLLRLHAGAVEEVLPGPSPGGAQVPSRGLGVEKDATPRPPSTRW